MPKISIITVCYNEPNLEKTCESIVNQTWQDFEWIVVDGGSNEETQKIWDKYKNRIDKFISEPDSGIYNAMNKGIKLASGEYLNFLNAGDYYYNNDTLKNVIELNLDKDIIDGNSKLFKNKKYFDENSPDNIDQNIFIRGSIPHQSSFIKKDLFNKYGLYDETYKIVSDWEKWIVFFVINNCSYKHINLVVAVFDTNGISTTQIKLRNQERKIILNKYFTKEEIKQAKVQYSFFEQIFSVKNAFDNRHKIITLFGIHIRIKRKNK